MGYQIRYGQAGKDMVVQSIPDRDGKIKNGALLKISVVTVFLIVAFMIWQFRGELCGFLLPGDSEVTAAALERLVESVADGEAIQTALTDFCREIIDHGLQAG